MKKRQNLELHEKAEKEFSKLVKIYEEIIKEMSADFDHVDTLITSLDWDFKKKIKQIKNCYSFSD